MQHVAVDLADAAGARMSMMRFISSVPTPRPFQSLRTTMANSALAVVGIGGEPRHAERRAVGRRRARPAPSRGRSRSAVSRAASACGSALHRREEAQAQILRRHVLRRDRCSSRLVLGPDRPQQHERVPSRSGLALSSSRG